MASNYIHNHIEEEDDEGYIDINLSSSSSSFCLNISSPQDIEFEFVSNDQEHEANVLPADELFYKGTLLPLHLPPRLQMLQNLLQNSSTNSCNIVSPSESFRSTSTDKLNDYFAELSSDDNFIVGRDIPKKSWPKKKLKSIKKFLHFKSLFLKSSSCSDVSNATAAVDKGGVGNISKGTINTSKKMSGWQIIRESVIPTSASVMNVKFQDPFNISHRRSFCGAITQNSTVKCSSLSSFSSSSSSSSSSSFSFDTNGSQGRSSGSDTEGSISAAIAHCKKSRDY